MEIGEEHPVFGQLVDGRGVDFRAKGADIGKAHVIGNQDQDVGAGVLCGGRTGERHEGTREGGHQITAGHELILFNG